MKRVLVVDDEEAICKIVKLKLEHSGFCEVQYATNASSAVDKALDFKPNIIFLDIVMQDIEGMELKSELESHALLSNVPIVFLTGMVTKDEADRQNALNSGNYFVSKPIDFELLLNKVVELA